MVLYSPLFLMKPRTPGRFEEVCRALLPRHLMERCWLETAHPASSQKTMGSQSRSIFFLCDASIKLELTPERLQSVSFNDKRLAWYHITPFSFFLLLLFLCLYFSYFWAGFLIQLWAIWKLAHEVKTVSYGFHLVFPLTRNSVIHVYHLSSNC